MKTDENYICKAKLDLRPGFLIGTDTSLVFQADLVGYERSISYTKIKEIFENEIRRDIGNVFMYMIATFLLLVGLSYNLMYEPIREMEYIQYLGGIFFVMGWYLETRLGLDLEMEDGRVVGLSGSRRDMKKLRRFLMKRMREWYTLKFN